LIKHTDLDIEVAACIYIIHLLPHPPNRQQTKSTQNSMLNAPKKDFSSLPVGKCGKSTKQSIKRRHQAEKGKSSLEGEKFRAL